MAKVPLQTTYIMNQMIVLYISIGHQRFLHFAFSAAIRLSGIIEIAHKWCECNQSYLSNNQITSIQIIKNSPSQNELSQKKSLDFRI